MFIYFEESPMSKLLSVNVFIVWVLSNTLILKNK